MKINYFVFISFMLLLVLTACSTTNQTILETTNTTTTSNGTNTTISSSTVSNDCEVERENMVLTWCDDFNGSGTNVNQWGIDEDKWDYQLGTGSQYGLNGWGNNEEQYYRKENVRTHDGRLIIEAKHQIYMGKPYTSGRLYTEPTFTQTYGRFEARMKLPTGEGFWPAFWLMPKESVYGGWPRSGEIDIMEARGRLPQKVGGTIIYQGTSGNTVYTGKDYYFPQSSTISDFHDYALEWEPGTFRFYVDGVLFNTINTYTSNVSFPAPFDQDFYIILNLAVGGQYDGGRLPSSTDFPALMEVEYVRVYQFDHSDDTTSPSDVSNIRITQGIPESTTIQWNPATDDIGLKTYEVYLNEELVGTTLATRYTFKNLSANTDYTVKIISIDLGNNKSQGVEYTLSVNYPTVPYKIEAEHYVQMNGIQVQSTSDTGGGENVGYIDNNDYMTYKVNVNESGTFKIRFRVASLSSGGIIALVSNNQSIKETTFTKTGGWQTWNTVESETFTLNEGVNTIKLLAKQGGFNLNWFEIVQA